MRFTLSAAATLAAVSMIQAAPAAKPAPAPAPTPVAEPAPAPYVAPAPYSAPAPSYAASSSSESEASRAPLAPVSDELFQNNPAREHSIAEILETPHRWYGREAAAIEVNPGDTGAVGIAVLNPLFVAFRKEQGGTLENAPWVNPTEEGADGRIAVGYMTPSWALAADIALFQVANDPPVDDGASSASYEMDRIGVFGSMPYGDASLYGRADWVTGEQGSWSAEEHSGRDWDYNVLLGYRTYVPGAEGTAYNAYLNYQMGYERNMGDEDPRYIHTIVLGGDYGTRRTRDNIVFLWGTNSMIGMINAKGNPDWDFMIGTRPNMGLEIGAFKNWTLKGGVGMDIAYNAWDSLQGDPSNIDRYLWTFQPEAALGLRYARGRWAAEALATGLISQGPWFLTGRSNALARFAITCDFGR